MANHNLPTTSSTYSNFVTELDSRLDDITKMLNSSNTTASNLPDGAIRWNSSNKNWQIISSGTWSELSSSYSININGTVGATTPTTGAFTTLSTSGIASLAANSTVGGAAIVSISATQTLSNKTLTSPVISSILNTGTITLPTATTTLVGRDTTDTLTNKTLTTPKFADGGSIADPNSNEYLIFDSVSGAVNEVTIANATTGDAPSIGASGTDTNINFNITSKGTGKVTINSVDAVTTSGTQTLTNKTIGTGSTYQGGAIGTSYGGTGNTAAPTAGGIIYAETTSKISSTAAGTAGFILLSGGAGAPTWQNPSSFSIGGTANNITAYTINQNVGSANSPTFAGLTLTGDISVGTAAKITFGSQTRQMLNLWGTTYALGVQTSTLYLRSDARFSWYRGGVHSDTENSAGTGGTVAMTLDNSSNLSVTNDITSFASDRRLKENITIIGDALNKVMALDGIVYNFNNLAKSFGFNNSKSIAGLLADQVESVLPQAVCLAPFDTSNIGESISGQNYKTVQYEKLVPLLVEAIKELNIKFNTISQYLVEKNHDN